MKRTWLGLTLAAALTAGGISVLNLRAADTAAGSGAALGRHRLWERAREKLNLTPEQTAQIRAVLRSEKDNLTSVLSRLHEARAALREAIQASDANESSVRAASAHVAAAEAHLAVERLKLHSRISPILTVEQREKINQFQARLDDAVDSLIGRLGEHLQN